MTGFTSIGPKVIKQITSADGATTWTKTETPTSINGIGSISYSVSLVPLKIVSPGAENLIKTDSDGKLVAQMEWTGTPNW
jgi:hypothetical protein